MSMSASRASELRRIATSAVPRVPEADPGSSPDAVAATPSPLAAWDTDADSHADHRPTVARSGRTASGEWSGGDSDLSDLGATFAALRPLHSPPIRAPSSARGKGRRRRGGGGGGDSDLTPVRAQAEANGGGSPEAEAKAEANGGGGPEAEAKAEARRRAHADQILRSPFWEFCVAEYAVRVALGAKREAEARRDAARERVLPLLRSKPHIDLSVLPPERLAEIGGLGHIDFVVRRRVSGGPPKPSADDIQRAAIDGLGALGDRDAATTVRKWVHTYMRRRYPVHGQVVTVESIIRRPPPGPPPRSRTAGGATKRGRVSPFDYSPSPTPSPSPSPSPMVRPQDVNDTPGGASPPKRPRRSPEESVGRRFDEPKRPHRSSEEREDRFGGAASEAAREARHGASMVEVGRSAQAALLLQREPKF